MALATPRPPRAVFKRVVNPFADLRPREHRRAIEAGVIAAALKIGRRRFSKASYSRVLAGRLQLVNPETVKHLRKAIQQAGISLGAPRKAAA